jgi:hypothetical protein
MHQLTILIMWSGLINTPTERGVNFNSSVGVKPEPLALAVASW